MAEVCESSVAPAVATAVSRGTVVLQLSNDVSSMMKSVQCLKVMLQSYLLTAVIANVRVHENQVDENKRINS